VNCREEPWAGDFVLRSCAIKESGKLERASFTVYRKGEVGTRPVAVLELTRNHSIGDAVTASTVEIFDPKLRRARWGTKLYERGLELACRHGMTFVSSSMRSEFSEAFWRKQVRKGRARCLRSTGKNKLVGSYYRIPKMELLEHGLTEAEVRAAIKKLPKPKRDLDGEGFWGCPRYAIKSSTCGRPSLDGVRRRIRKVSP
jgi:hypothetical protein